jgi:hypothetical protein
MGNIQPGLTPHNFNMPVWHAGISNIVRQPYYRAKETFKDRRNFWRYKPRKNILSVCEHNAGQILDISLTGMAFKISHCLERSGDGKIGNRPKRSDTINILGPALDGYIMREVPVKTIADRSMGHMYPGNKNIQLYRRMIQFAAPLTESQFSCLLPYLRAY